MESFDIKGEDILDLKYEPIFDYFADNENSFLILDGDFVNTEDGTGIVHIAPAFGEDDFLLCKKNKINPVCPVDEKGNFDAKIDMCSGINVFDSIDIVLNKIKEKNLIVKIENYHHNYPHCWRTDSPLIYKLIDSWYLKVEDIKDKLIDVNKQINWMPSNVKDGLFGKWLENARDWSISRNRFWGCPIPIWISDDEKYPRIDVYGSIEELEKDFDTKVTSLHKPFIDSLIRSNPDDPTGKSKMKRVPDVLDCWFESGAMPYASIHYPFENKEWFDSHFPSDFITEYIAQTRGWFYSLTVLATALFDKPPFLNCICHGVVLDKNKQKLSKRLKNFPDPKEMFNKYGSDAMRVMMCKSPVVNGTGNLYIDPEGDCIKEVHNNFISSLHNAFVFFKIYIEIDQLELKYSFASKNKMDIYISSKLKNLALDVEDSMDKYDIMSSINKIESFVEILNNWYIRRNKHRFWKSEIDSDKHDAYNTLYSVLKDLALISSIFTPCISEEIFIYLSNYVNKKNRSNSDY